MTSRNEKVVALFLTLLIVVSTVAPAGAMVGTTASGNDSLTDVAGNQSADQLESENEPDRSDDEETGTPDETIDRPPVTEGPPIVQRVRAVRLVGGLDGHDQPQTVRTLAAYEHLNDSLYTYQDPVRLNDSGVFTNDSNAVRVLATYVETSQEANATRASRLVYQADNRSAHAAVADANRTLARFGDDMANQGRRTAAETHLANARRALERAEEANASASDGRAAFRARARAISHLRTAHHQAQLALRFVDEETTPRITITSYADPIRNGSEGGRYTVRGEITAVRPSTIENVTIVTDDNRTIVARTNIDRAAPGRNASYAARVNLTERVVALTAIVTEEPDRGDDYEGESDQSDQPAEQEDRNGPPADRGGGNDNGPPADRGNGNGPPEDRGNGNGPPADRGNGNEKENGNGNGPPEDRGNGNGNDSPESGGPDTPEEAPESEPDGRSSTQQSSTTLLLDGDGLPAPYEQNVTGTDPLNPDSNSTAVVENNSADGVIDGREDFDGDLLTSVHERALGTDPVEADTDGDGLEDGNETVMTNTDPLAIDTDGNGTLDSQEDPDGDRLTHAAELANGTDPLYSDIDFDSLTDGEEVLDYGTNATLRDTDGDDLTDGAEIELGTDPLLADTDGDGVNDSNETFETTTTDNETGVTLEVSGEGDDARGVTVESPEQYNDSSTVSAGPTIQLDGMSDDANATVSLPIQENESTEEATVFVRNNSMGSMWTEVNTTVDETNGTATANVSSVDFVTVLNATAWEEGTTAPDPEPTPAAELNGTCVSNCETENGSIIIGAFDGEPLNDSERDQSTSENYTSDETTDQQGYSGPTETVVFDPVSPVEQQPAAIDDAVALIGIEVGGTIIFPDVAKLIDKDNDGVPDQGDNCKYHNPSQADADDDGTGDKCDDDADGDGYDEDNDPDDTDSSVPDSDGDGVRDSEDNCDDDPNAGQSDTDHDGVGDACDTSDDTGDGSDDGSSGEGDSDDSGSGSDDTGDDSGSGQSDRNADRDGDGIPNIEDNCPRKSNYDQQNSDDYWKGDACDDDDDGDGFLDEEDSAPKDDTVPDEDGDGVLNDDDNCRKDSNEGQADYDEDGEGDACDNDVDDDGVLKSEDPKPWNETVPDQDGDGVTNAKDNCDETPNPEQADYDENGEGDACDDDDDGDELLDHDERDRGTGVRNVDSDDDDLSDGTEVKRGLDPLDDDSDDDSVIDGEDDCAGQRGVQDNGCPVGGVQTVTLDLPEAQEIQTTFEYQTRDVGYNPEVSLTVEGEYGNEQEVPITRTDNTGATRMIDLSAYAGQEVTLQFETQGVVTLVEDFDTRKDSDGDGIWDFLENDEWTHPGTFEEFSTEANSRDTDWDTLTDSEEITLEERGADWELVSMTADPTDIDSDDDGLLDSVELEEYEIEAIEKGGEPFRWNSETAEGQTTTITVEETDPRSWDTDGDGLSDRQEREELHTDPTQRQTYGITEQHENLLKSLSERSVIAIRQPDPSDLGPVSDDTLSTIEGQSSETARSWLYDLDDGSDDFDFVTDDTPENYGARSKVVFTTMDGQDRTDTWLSNSDELALGTDPYDPDYDDDGLTDGQERGSITTAENWDISVDKAHENTTDPRDPDTDGDGYWDGWIGVYDVGKTDNVILYREHLRDEDDTVSGTYIRLRDGTEVDITRKGVRDNETVPEQAGIHQVTDDPMTASATSADLPGRPGQWHSNLHIGELQWGTQPENDESIPEPSITIEVDFDEQVPHGQVNKQTWEDSIERNYALYGIEVNLIRDDVLHGNPGGTQNERVDDGIDVSGITSDELQVLRTDEDYGAAGPGYEGLDAVEYLWVGNHFEGSQRTAGNNPLDSTMAIALNTIVEEVESGNYNPPMEDSPYQSETEMLAAMTTVHEIAHSFCVGISDDAGRGGERGSPEIFSKDNDMGTGCSPNTEVYSGLAGDKTPEYTEAGRAWSIMTSPIVSSTFNSPMNGEYFAFSIEEITSIRIGECPTRFRKETQFSYTCGRNSNNN